MQPRRVSSLRELLSTLFSSSRYVKKKICRFEFRPEYTRAISATRRMEIFFARLKPFVLLTFLGEFRAQINV